MDIKKIFAVDEVAELEGVDIDLDDASGIRVARVNNRRFRDMFERLAAPYRSAARKGILSEEIANNILLKCMSETILVGWWGFEEDGKDVPYSSEKAYEYLKNVEEFRSFVESCAENLELYRIKEDEDTEKN